jgi:hypothetical protein
MVDLRRGKIVESAPQDIQAARICFLPPQWQFNSPWIVVPGIVAPGFVAASLGL